MRTLLQRLRPVLAVPSVVSKRLKFSAALDVPLTQPWPGRSSDSPSRTHSQSSLADASKAIRTDISTLPSGLRVASENSPGAFCTVGLVVDAGSRYENTETMGVFHMMDRMSFKSTRSRTQQQLASDIEHIGGNAFCQGMRDCMMYYISVSNQDLEKAVEILADVVQHANFTEDELAEQRQLVRYEKLDLLEKPDMYITELLHATAYKDNTLGLPLICPDGNIDLISTDMLREAHAQFYIGPRMVLSASGVDHADLVALATKYFSGVPKTSRYPLGPAQKAVYTGGEIAVFADLPLVHITLGFEGVSWDDPDLYAICTMQMLMGGGGSFSAGGPGKGMHSRLYRRVLNRYHWVESCTAHNTCHTDSGLFSIYGTAPPAYANSLLEVMKGELLECAERIEAEELQRAKNQLKSSLLMSLESRVIQFDDIGRQVLTSGRRIPPHDLCASIDKVTAQDINRVARRMLSSRPSLAVYGDLPNCK